MAFNRLNTKEKAELRTMVAEDRFSTGESNLDLHSRDMSRHRPSRPEAVIWPLHREEVSMVLSYCNRRLIPVTAWGAGTSLEGNPIPMQGGVVLDFSRMNRIVDIRTDDFQADVEPGVVYQDLNHKLRHSGLFFPPDPGARATVGGMIGNNASGTRTVRYGSTRDHVLRMSVVLANGELIEVGTRASKSSSGYDLVHLFIGSEGTLGVVVEATLRLVGLPEEFASAVATFQTVEAAAKAVFKIRRSGVDPAALELLAPECLALINKVTTLNLNLSPTLWIELHGPTKNQLSEAMKIVREICEQEGSQHLRPGIERGERDRLLEARHRLGEMIEQNHPGASRITIDVAVPISAYPEMIAFGRREVAKVEVASAYIFGHAGDGNIHLTIVTEEGGPQQDQIDEVNHRVVRKALSLGGTATGEHGVGIGKAVFMPGEHGSSLAWMQEVKKLFDPNGILNPGKMFPNRQ
ncbi:MAG: FAD-binding oxidoreductase [Thermodesulfobacteriota bacterium]